MDGAFNSASNELGPRPTGTFAPQKNQPRSVYIHIPFCRHRCGYCNFSLVAGRDYLIERFLHALETEIGWLGQTFEIDTLFLGGGTPSHLSPRQLGRLGEIIRTKFVLAKNAEVSAECNPNDLSEPVGEALAGLGVNRVSLGVQSLDREKLKRLERGHCFKDVENAVNVARGFFQSVSIDLIFAAPHETLEQWHHDLDDAMALSPDHVSTYELTFEKGTRFWARRSGGDLSEAEEDLRAEMYTLAIDQLARHGVEQYEVSSFAKPNHVCRHNLVYWTGDPYFAFGPGASRFVDGIRETNHQGTMQYLKRIESSRSPVAEREELTGRAAAKERLAIGLRMLDGLDDAQFVDRTGISIGEVLGSLAQQLIENGLMIQRGENWKLSGKGILMCDWIAGEIMDC